MSALLPRPLRSPPPPAPSLAGTFTCGRFTTRNHRKEAFTHRKNKQFTGNNIGWFRAASGRRGAVGDAGDSPLTPRRKTSGSCRAKDAIGTAKLVGPVPWSHDQRRSSYNGRGFNRTPQDIYRCTKKKSERTVPEQNTATRNLAARRPYHSETFYH